MIEIVCSASDVYLKMKKNKRKGDIIIIAGGGGGGKKKGKGGGMRIKYVPVPVFMPMPQSKTAMPKAQIIEAQVVQAMPASITMKAQPQPQPIIHQVSSMPVTSGHTSPQVMMMMGKDSGQQPQLMPALPQPQPQPAQPIHGQVVNVMPMQSGGWD